MHYQYPRLEDELKPFRLRLSRESDMSLALSDNALWLIYMHSAFLTQ